MKIMGTVVPKSNHLEEVREVDQLLEEITATKREEAPRQEVNGEAQVAAILQGLHATMEEETLQVEVVMVNLPMTEIVEIITTIKQTLKVDTGTEMMQIWTIILVQKEEPRPATSAIRKVTSLVNVQIQRQATSTKALVAEEAWVDSIEDLIEETIVVQRHATTAKVKATSQETANRQREKEMIAEMAMDSPTREEETMTWLRHSGSATTKTNGVTQMARATTTSTMMDSAHLIIKIRLEIKAGPKREERTWRAITATTMVNGANLRLQIGFQRGVIQPKAVARKVRISLQTMLLDL